MSKIYTKKQHVFRKYKISGFKLNQTLKLNEAKQTKQKQTMKILESDHVKRERERGKNQCLIAE